MDEAEYVLILFCCVQLEEIRCGESHVAARIEKARLGLLLDLDLERMDEEWLRLEDLATRSAMAVCIAWLLRRSHVVRR